MFYTCIRVCVYVCTAKVLCEDMAASWRGAERAVALQCCVDQGLRACEHLDRSRGFRRSPPRRRSPSCVCVLRASTQTALTDYYRHMYMLASMYRVYMCTSTDTYT